LECCFKPEFLHYLGQWTPWLFLTGALAAMMKEGYRMSAEMVLEATNTSPLIDALW